MAQRILRPLSYGDLFDEVFDLYKKHFVLFVGIAGVIIIPLYAIAYAIGNWAAGIVILFASLLSFVVMAATTWAVSRCYLGQEATIADAYKATRGRIAAFAITLLVAGLIIILGYVLLIVPGIIFSFWYAFISEVYMLEGKTGDDGRSRSRQLAADNWGRIFVIWLLSSILMWIVSAALTYPVQIIAASTGAHTTMMGGPIGLLYGIVAGASSALTTPIQVIASVLLYYDIRVRKEGFDIQMLAANMGGSVETAPAVTDEVKPF